ncbi:hypothetical protein HOBO_276 [Bacillus phage Hobo]|uniref:Uncharacterized protein n=2 Tax=Caeruleovirus BM15 TaxID=1985178 RepID=A0A0S2MUW8_9CAUD|nr:hypothetical protein FD732_gp015 [Bacillus phage BM15]YP_009626829.1 hypothetical protein FD732_gp065 [Bacillus phage BM15]AXQ66796.1 hypothetical protein HOBO_15 [Bacillus phage Hobo]ALO79436.1 hypothetical protein BM10_15 [Bacillus phage BM15]ALO79684.1 hypothetical protein BM10_280 [Bacillus phage BM15]AXQ67031.1 hypothetical protein HOBO_276 [Bacillus phage Hobo]
MTNTNTYNGWANRETWLVNVHFGNELTSYIVEQATDGIIDITQDEGTIRTDIERTCESYFDDMLEEELNGLGSFLSDYIDLSLIDWDEIAEHIYSDDIKNMIDELEASENEEEEEEEE